MTRLAGGREVVGVESKLKIGSDRNDVVEDKVLARVLLAADGATVDGANARHSLHRRPDTDSAAKRRRDLVSGIRRANTVDGDVIVSVQIARPRPALRRQHAVIG